MDLALGTDLYLAAQTGTYSSTGPSVSLSGGTAFNGFQTLAAAGAVNADDYYCTIRDASGNSLVWQATYSSTGPTLTRSSAISAIGSIADAAPVSLYVWSRAQKPTAAGLALMEAVDSAAQRTTLSVRELLTAARTYYVATTGSDSNDGLSAGAPFLTIQKAVDVVCSIDGGVQAVTISVADGTYTAGVALKAPVGSGTFTIQGNTTTPANCVISPTSGSAITANGAGKWTIKGVKLTTTSAGRGIIALGSSTQLSISYIEFGSVNYEHIYLSNGAALSIGGAWAISGSAIAHILVSSGGQFNAGGITCTITNTPAFSNGFATASNLGVIVVVSLTFSGSATGKRYDATTNGVIQTYGGGASYFPGNASGTTATGGVYA